MSIVRRTNRARIPTRGHACRAGRNEIAIGRFGAQYATESNAPAFSKCWPAMLLKIEPTKTVGQSSSSTQLGSLRFGNRMGAPHSLRWRGRSEASQHGIGG